MLREMWYSRGHPSGYTDDLGIIADRNQWVKAEPPGWYVGLSDNPFFNHSVLDWCKDNLDGQWQCVDVHKLWLANHDDATLFKMRWY